MSEEVTSNDQELKDKVIEAIKLVYDPEIPVNVFDLGLIYDIQIYPVKNIHVLMTLTSPSCPSAGEIPGNVEAKIREIEGISDVHVELTFDPPYTQDMMSDAAKLELGFL
ncbi:MAG TPA: SUF system Fe-S cluster assembly protein [Cytophagaceae bacterium]|jgi:FeS assembly SUF system protein|nr:SUF system Fe-S cluster assembly protein [Cytophagaceae bacterium]